MTQEDKERIEHAAAVYYPFSKDMSKAFVEGCTHQHPIAFKQGETKGFNESLDVIKKYVARIQKLEAEITDLKLELESEVNLKERGFNEGIDAARKALFSASLKSDKILTVFDCIEEIFKLKK